MTSRPSTCMLSDWLKFQILSSNKPYLSDGIVTRTGLLISFEVAGYFQKVGGKLEAHLNCTPTFSAGDLEDPEGKSKHCFLYPSTVESCNISKLNADNKYREKVTTT